MVESSGLLEGDIGVFYFKIPKRYVVSLAIVTVVKLVLAAVLYFLLGLGSFDSFWMDTTRVEPLAQNNILLEVGSQATRWAYLFLGWDSAWYASITAHGYSFSNQSYAFLPGLPILARGLQIFLGSPIVALVVCCFIFGVLWIPIYQSVAEHYMGHRAAFVSSLIFALSPFTLLFTTVAYTEGPFLFFTLVAWKLYLDRRYLSTSLVSAAASLMRIPGFLIVLPIMVDLSTSRKRGSRLRAVLIGLPTVVVLICWIIFMGLSVGDPFAILHTTEWSEMYSLPTYLMYILPEGGFGALSFPIASLEIHLLLPVSIWCAILLSLILIWRVSKFDRSLSLYCVAYVMGLFAFGALVSFPRFMTALFPLWLPFTGAIISRKWSVILFIVASVASGLLLWAGFLSGVFVA